MTYFFVQNSRGDVIKLLNENGDIIRDYEYEPFGKEQDVKTDGYGADYFSAKWKQEVEDNAIDNPFRFGGEYKDEESGNYYLRARYYDPEIQRFTQEDTYSGTYGDPMSQNGYAFCGNNPINFIDPTGHWQESDKKYDSATQQKIIKATNDYYAAKTPEGREAAHDAANAARKAGDKNGNGSLGKTVNTYYNTQTGNKGYVTGSEWESTLTSATKLLTGLSGGSQVNMTGEKRDNSREHAIMDVAGLVPVIGEPCDLINTISYLTEGDYKNAGLSATSMIPIAGSLKGLKYVDEAADLAKISDTGKIVKSAKSVLKDAMLPTKGKIRYIPPEKWTASQPLPRKNGGYVDKFGNIWIKGPSRTEGQVFEWDVQLSKKGKSQFDWASKDGSHLNVSLNGEITHK